MTTLYDYDDSDAPVLRVITEIHHPYSKGRPVIGHVCDTEDRGRVAAFPRSHRDHYFRKYAGYAVSEAVLDLLKTYDVEMVFIVETDDGDVFEYTADVFDTARLLAYDPEGETVREAAGRRNPKFDYQRVVPTDEAVRTWDRDELTLHQ